MKTEKRVSEIDENLIFVSDSQDVEEIKMSIDPKIRGEFDSFFVKVEDGDYSEIWGMEGIIPYLYKKVYLVK